MAESVKRRVAAARLAVAFVAAGTIAGATTWAQASSAAPTAHSSILISSLKLKLDSSNIKNGSLMFKDFIKGEVPSDKQFKNFEASFKSFKYDNAKSLDSIKGEISSIKGELGSYLKSTDADSRFWKRTDSVVQGDGSVRTATGLQTGKDPVQLLDLPGLVKVVGLPGALIQITNTGEQPLTHTACQGAPGAGAVPAGVLDPGASFTCDGSVSQLLPAVQLIGTGARPTVMTLSFSSIDLARNQDPGSQDTVQILIGL